MERIDRLPLKKSPCRCRCGRSIKLWRLSLPPAGFTVSVLPTALKIPEGLGWFGRLVRAVPTTRGKFGDPIDREVSQARQDRLPLASRHSSAFSP
jgi:hypothetical protein